jgi:hypothetical protein
VLCRREPWMSCPWPAAGRPGGSVGAPDELAVWSIHSGCVSPGPVDTGFFGNLDEVSDLV